MSFQRGEDFAGHRDGVVAGEFADVTPILWSLAAMTAHTINNLPHPTDADFSQCDPLTCAPCDGLYRMYHLGALDDFLRPYVESSGASWDWWVGDEKTGHLDWEWITARSAPGAGGPLDEDEVTPE